MTANNKYVSDYNSTKESNDLMYLDVNNLYGYAMPQYLPHKNFKWLDDCNDINKTTVEEDSEFGYILEVDLEYPNVLKIKIF